MSDVLKVKNLLTQLKGLEQDYAIVDDLSFNLKKGKTLALLGESGCGKSMTALSLLGITPKPATKIHSGEVIFQNHDILTYSEQQIRALRGKRISMIFQEPMTSLNPVMTIHQQIAEVLDQNEVAAGDINQEIVALLKSVGISDAKQRMYDYPHQFSGGMKQRVMVAMALATKPDILIADEPTTALDVTIQAQVLSLIKDMQQQKGMAILLITHDLGIVRQMADDVAIMYAGQIVEMASCETFFKQAHHPYSKALFKALPSIDNRKQKLNVIKGMVPSLAQQFKQCRFINRCEVSQQDCKQVIPLTELTDTDTRWVRCLHSDAIPAEQAPEIAHQDSIIEKGLPLLEVSNLKTHFPIRRGLLKRIQGYVYAVDGVSFSINKGETLALVGESGCGKTSVGKSLVNLLDESQMNIKFEGQAIDFNNSKASKAFRDKVQFIFQDPFSAMNPRMSIKQIMAEGIVAREKLNNQQLEDKIEELLNKVGLEVSAMFRYPHEFSGGQRQRICIARALAVNPEFMVCDEPTSALDVSVQAQILNLLKQLQIQQGLSYLFITHNMSVVSWLADKVAVMYLGRIVEYGTVDQVLNSPKHPYTQALLEAVPNIDKTNIVQSEKLQKELPSPIFRPQGCFFHPRCKHSTSECEQHYPATKIINQQQVNCHLYE